MTNCYLCKSTELTRRPGSVRDKLELEIIECASCGLVFLSSFDHIIDGFYENSEMHGCDNLDIQTWLNETAWDDERRFQYLKSVLPNCRLLDFGCGAGGFLMKARSIASISHGIEPERRLSNYYRTNKLTVFQNLSEIQMDYKYDIITMFHVLEHIPDPKSILIKLSELLVRGGQIVIEVPNANDALLTLYNCLPFSQFTYWSCHLFLFTSKTLKMLFDQIDFRVNYIKQIQRYPLSNHLYWLAQGLPGGHQKWYFLDSPLLNNAYEKALSAIEKCDTIIASISKL